MIKILGKKVVAMLVALVLLNGGVGYGLYEYLTPMRISKESQLAAIHAEIEQRRQEVAKLKEELIMLQMQMRDFKELEALGFFNNQNRVKAQEAFDKLRQVSGLLKTTYDIKSGELISDPLATDANHVVVSSIVGLEMDSLDDVDVYTFIKGLQEKFPGSVDLTKITLTRDETITAPLLRKIGSGQPVKLVTAKVEFDWRTMANRDRLNETDRESRSSEKEALGEQSAAPQVPAPAAPEQSPVTGGAL